MEHAPGTQLVLSAQRENIPNLVGKLYVIYVPQEKRRNWDHLDVTFVVLDRILIRIVFVKFVLLENHRV